MLMNTPEKSNNLLFIETPDTIIPRDNRIKRMGIRFSFNARANKNPNIIIFNDNTIQVKETILLI